MGFWVGFERYLRTLGRFLGGISWLFVAIAWRDGAGDGFISKHRLADAGILLADVFMEEEGGGGGSESLSLSSIDNT